MKLYVIQYQGLDYKKNDDERTRAVFHRDCGLVPVQILDEPSREELISFLTSSNFDDATILHFISHGSIGNGIVQMIPGAEHGDKKSLVTWQELSRLFDLAAAVSPQLFVNLGTVCNSTEIMPFLEKRDFSILVTNMTVSDPVYPKKINFEFVRASANNRGLSLQVNPGYSFYP